MVRHRLRVFQCAGAFEVFGNAGRSSRVIADLGFYPCRPCVALDHAVGVGLCHAVRLAGYPPRASHGGFSHAPFSAVP
jgi:hypothetical protein